MASNIPIIEDAGSMKNGVWVPDWKAMTSQAKKLGAKTVKTRSGKVIYFDNNYNPTSVDENPQMKSGGWLDKYEQGGMVLKQKTEDNYFKKPNPNEAEVSMPPGYVGMGNNTKGRDYSPAWGGQFQRGGKLPTIYTEDPNKVKAYSDSLSLYNMGKKFYKDTYNFTDDKLLTFTPTKETYKGWKKKDIIKSEKEYLQDNILNEFGPSWDNESIKRQRLFNKMAKKALATDNIPIGFYPGEGYYPTFKKPVQPVEYKKDEYDPTVTSEGYEKDHPPIYLNNPKDERIGKYTEAGNQYLYKKPTVKSNFTLKRQNYNPELLLYKDVPQQGNIDMKVPNISQQKNDYRVDYTDPETGKGTYKDFPNEKMGSEFQRSIEGNRTGYYKKFEDGGELTKKKLLEIISKKNQLVNRPLNRPSNYTLKDPRNSDVKYPTRQDDIKQVIASAVGMGYDPKKALAVALQETGIGRTDDNYFHVVDAMDDPMLTSSEAGVQALKYKQSLANKLGYNTPEMELQTFNGLGKIFPDTEKTYHGFRMKKIYGVPIPEEGIDMKKNPLYGKRVMDLKKNIIDEDPYINKTIDYYNKFYNDPNSVYYTKESELPTVEVGRGKHLDFHVGEPIPNLVFNDKHSILFKYGGELGQAQTGISFLPEQDPEMIYKNKFNTELNKEEKKEFNEWITKESKRQGRDILMDKGAYDVQGFWKSGDYKNIDEDNHGSDKWKKPNHPTFSNQSKYHGVDGFYGGNWTEEAGYQPSKQTADMYSPDYYKWMFSREPNRPEHLDNSRFESGANSPSPLYYAMGGSLPGSVGFTYARTGDIPSNGKYAKKTLASAQNGQEMSYYQHGLDFKTKGMKNGGWLDAYDVPQAQDGESFFKAPDVPEYAKGRDVLTPQQVIDVKKYQDDRSQEIVDQIRNKKSTLKQGQKETKKEAEYRIRKNEQFQQLHPYSNIDEQGTLSRSQSDRTMEGIPEAYSRAYYNDQALDKAMTSLDAAGYITGAGELLGAAAPIMKEAVKDAGNSLKNLKQEFIYNAIDPVGYGAKAKVLKSPKTFLENTIFRPENRAFKIGEELHPTWYTDRGLNNLIGTDPYYIEKIEEINRLGKNRLDAWRTGLGLEQKYNTFTKTPEGVFRINSMSPEPKEFAALYNDIVAHNYNTNGSGMYSGENPLVTLQKKYQDVASPKIQTDYGEFSINDLLGTRKGEVTPWKQVRKVKKESIYSNDASIFDSDNKQGIMGGYRWDVKKLPDGNLHFQSNDTWDLHPWQKRGNPNLFEDELSKKLQNLHTIPKLKNIETLKLLGGKPYNIQNNFIVDPKTYKTIKSYKKGGVVKDDMGYWNPENHGKVVEIDSNDITMEGVDEPLIGISDEGDKKYMLPGKNYKFKGKKVREYPVAKNGLRQEQKGLQNLDQLTNFTNYNKPQPGGWLNKYN